MRPISFKLLGEYLKNNLEVLVKNNLKLNILGDISKFPKNLKQSLNKVMKQSLKIKKCR